MPEIKLNEKRILDYVEGFLYFYGAMDFEGLYLAVADRLSDIERKHLNSVLDKVLEMDDTTYDFIFEDGLYCNMEVEDPQWVLREQDKRAEIPFRPVTEDEIRQVVAKRYSSFWPLGIRRLSRKLQDYGWAKDGAEVKILFGQTMIRNDVSHVQLVEYFLADMELASFEEVQPLINLINDLSNRTPQWILKGWSPEEVFERYEKPALKPLPAVPFDFKGAQSDKKTSPKVGRNEPCPCGSGKKYKKCCSAVVNEEIQEEQIALAFEDLLMDGGNPDLNGRETAVVGKEKPAMDEQEKLDPKKQETAPEEKEPTLEEWGMLYEAATAFKEARCWEWMDDDDLFGVMDPETGLIAYCCIMGRLGEHYALGAYLGPQGLESIYDLMEGSGDFSPDLMLSQKCLMASFEDREYINKRDRAVINELGLKFRGRGQWPLFRSYEPGLYPWFITSRECRFLTLVLEQALAVSLRCQNGKALLDGDQPTAYLVRVPGGQGQELTWEDRYLEAEPYTEECISFPIYDELALKKLAASGKKNGAIWEVDIFTVPNPVQEKKNERPFYPKGFLILESPHGLLLGFVLMKDYSKEGHKCIERFIGLVERLGVPARIDVEKEETYCLLSDTCRLLNISLNVVDRLECLPGAREVMFGRLRQR